MPPVLGNEKEGGVWARKDAQRGGIQVLCTVENGQQEDIQEGSGISKAQRS